MCVKSYAIEVKLPKSGYGSRLFFFYFKMTIFPFFFCTLLYTSLIVTRILAVQLITVVV